jgi:serine/threonine-protein kinase
MISQNIAHYRFVSKLGEGGMGEVWRATDTKLGRDVAIKILPEDFAADPSRVARVEREARILAALNHPNIAQIFGIEEGALVMELVEGKPVSGPLPLETALDYARQIADALGAAHDKGIVHRDLKPANILVTGSGIVKLLDFGLAKAADEPASGTQNSVTVSLSRTDPGVILGTPAYMAPEQARGVEADKRADIWAFGCVLYEMLTGKRAFTGETTADVLASVVSGEPDLTRIPAKARRLIEFCLKKDLKQRLQAIGDWRLLLDNAEAPAVSGGSRLPWLAAAVLASIALIGWFQLWRAARPVDHPLTRLNVDLGPDAIAGSNIAPAISPDGRRLVYAARGSDGRQQLATRLLAHAQHTLLPGTDNAQNPFFSRDGEWLGFNVGTELKKISMGGGPPLVLARSPTAILGADWGDDGNIIATLNVLGGLWRIPGAGGVARSITGLASGDLAYCWPQVLPGGVILFTASASPLQFEDADIEVFTPKTNQTKILLHGGYYARYLPSGHLVFMHQGLLFGTRFDPKHLVLNGTPTALLDDVNANPLTGAGEFNFSRTGTFIYASGKRIAQAWQLDWLDSSGRLQPLMDKPGAYALPRFSPDGRKLAFVENGNVSVHDLERDTTIRLTFTGNVSTQPVWAPDGRHIVFGSNSSLFWIRSDGVGNPYRLFESRPDPRPWSFSPDGRWLAYFVVTPPPQDPSASLTGFDIWILPLDLTNPDEPRAEKPQAFLRTAANELLPAFSPDGRWIAYRSNESGTPEIYVRPFPAADGGKWQISNGGGLYGLWSKNGRELFYETLDNRIMVVDYRVDGAAFVPGRPRLWSDKRVSGRETLHLDLAPDGKRFVVLAQTEIPGREDGSAHVTMLFNFFDDLKKRIP